MIDEQIPLTPPTTPLMNTPESRTPTGEILDQGAAPIAAPPVVDPAPPGLPETYTFTPPEGVTYDPKLIEEVSPIFKELKLDQASAQKLVDVYNKQIGGTQAELLKTVEKTRTDWRAATKADPEIGAKLESVVLPEIGRMLDKLAPEVSKNLRMALDFTGAGDNPAVVRGYYELAKLVNEGTHVVGAAPSIHGQNPGGKATPPSLAQAMYPNLVTQ